ncbi:MAG: hypothetical protein J4432_01290 [DPANN group archaeon]|nr:hypothetical protein [DPANN group archaeon]
MTLRHDIVQGHWGIVMKVEIDLMKTESPEALVDALRGVFSSFSVTGQRADKILGSIDDADFESEFKLRGPEFLKQSMEEQGYIDLSKMALLAKKLGPDQGFPLGKIRVFR